MALSDLDVREQYAADGVLTTFAIPYAPIFDDSAETLVYVDDTLQVEGALQDYTLTGAPDVNSFHVNVEFVAAPADGTIVTVIRSLPLTQTLDLVSAGTVNLATLERHLDGIVAKIQQIDEKLKRSPKFKVTIPYIGDNPVAEADLSLPDPTSENMLGWNEDGDAIINVTRAEIANDDLSQLIRAYVAHTITDGQAATDLSGETVDGGNYTSAPYYFEATRGSTVMATGNFSLQYKNGTWRIEDGGYEGDAHGLTFTLTQTTTVAQLEVALDAGAGNGELKLSRRIVPA